VRRPAPTPAKLTAHPDGAYLVTGGTGGLGLCVAEWLAALGAGEIVLLSRSGLPDDPTDARQQRLTRLRERGCEVRVVCGDVADPVAMGSLVRGFSSTQRPLRGIVHAAVQMSSAPIALLDTEMLSSMRRSKIASTRVLDRLTADLALDFFVLFSSTTALLGVHGLAHYAAANQYLDAVAQHRRARAQAATSIAWGTWDVMRIASAEAQATIVRGGLHQLPSSLALELQGRLVADGTTTAVVADVDWQTLVPLYEARRVRPLIHELATTADVDSSRAADTVGELGAAPPSTAESTPLVAIRAATAVDRLPMLQHVVRREVAAVLGYGSSDGIPLERGFFELGLDSLMSVELKRRLESAVEHRLPSTLTFNYPNVSALAHFLDGELFTAAVPASPPPVTLSAPAATGTRDSDALTEAELESELLSRLESLR
jgi:NAD(P)-dependent dehydrogenase (short-subunit alcohol dehydrogenase family)/acyl carrier protein